MILVDANLLVYATVANVAQHRGAKRWLDSVLNGDAPVGLPWPSLLAYLRLVTNPRVVDSPASPARAWSIVELWLGCRTAWIPQPTQRHQELLARIYDAVGPAANLVPDAHIAALAMEHGLTVYTTDGDFARFRGLKWVNPLSESARTSDD